MAPEAAAERLGFVTLEQFLQKLPPELKILHDGGNGSGTLRWVEPSELDDPTPYLVDGEFILTAGLPFLGDGGGDEKVDAYVSRLVGAGVGALGFGLEPYFDAVPETLVAACRRHNLTLLEVPKTVPFAAIGLEFSQLLESDNARVFRQLADTNRQLMRAVLSARPEHELLAALVQRVPVWALLVGADGRTRARATAPGSGGAGSGTARSGGAGSGAISGNGSLNPPAAVELSVLQPLLGRLLAGSGPRVEMESLAEPASVVFGHPLRSTRDANLGALVLGAAAPLTPAQNSVVSSVVGLLELLVRQRTSGSLAPSQLATALLLHPETAGSGGTKHVNGLKDLLAQSISSTRSAPLRVVQGVKADAGWSAGESPVRELLQWRRMFDTKLVEITDYGFAAITRLKVDDALLAETEKLGWRLVIGDATEFQGLASAYQRVTSLRARVHATGRSARVDEVTWSVAGLLGREAGTMLAARLLEPVLGQEDPERRSAQLAVLRTWLGENGSWDATAKALGLHRNSVRRQINGLAELLDTDLNQAQVRAELWFALQYVDEDSQPR
ncbi:PucR family transcriptional regulator [Arthrobacter sp. ISL-72]|uniref:PucR family transcriptional regulator n=1 Tax=Arthrobacter sp. ISL-72 TaxID=2819114 RepID=UPI001BEA94BE|nr:PucR family transcriptional regulator [Arthrobacter sp. ISL-72]MBT2595629.1 PucR family transcriptional regulator [Arthrobacter sp. ISL-72]